MTNTKIIAPTDCPSCGSLLERVNDQLFCPNKVDCPAQTSKKLQNFCKNLKIKGFGEATIEKLGFVSINELILADESEYIEAGFSQTMASKLAMEVDQRLARKFTIPEFISSMSIPLIGNSAGAKLANVESIDSLYSVEYLTSLGLGEKASSNLSQWVLKEWPMYKELWNPLITIKSQTSVTTDLPSKGVVVITGKLNDFKNRSDATVYLENLGFEVKTSVTKATDYLISEDGSRGSSYTKAQQNNIRILTIKELEDIHE